MRKVLCLWMAMCVLVPVAGASLVVVAPTRDGLLIAADSRRTVAGRYCDNAFKIRELGNRRHTVFAVTGMGIIAADPPAPVADICRYIQTARAILDIPAVIAGYLESSGRPLRREDVEHISQLCIAAVLDYEQRQLPFQPLKRMAGAEMFAVVIAEYRPAESLAVVANFTVGISAQANPEVVRKNWREIGPDERDNTMMMFGETKFLDQHVYTSGRAYLKEFAAFAYSDKPVKRISAKEARAAAVNLIQAAEKTAQTIPPPAGIGGPVDVLLIGKGAAPVRLQWKGQ